MAVREEHLELRVHGVAGTAPAAMLQLAPVQVAPPAPAAGAPPHAPAGGDAGITEWRRPDRRPHLRAWSWGSLTSGRWYHAFYLLLLPFMLANLAGWMLVPGPLGEDGRARTPRFRATVLAVRVVGLAVTALFVLWVQLVVADLVFYQRLVRQAGGPAWWVGAGTAATAAVLLLVVALTRFRPRAAWRAAGIRTRAWDVWTDPVGDAFLHRGQHPMWNSPGINVGLRRLHLGGGLAVVALVASWDTGVLPEPWRTVATAAWWLAVAGLVVVLGLVAWISLADGRPPAGYPDAADCGCHPDGRSACTGATGRGLPPRALVRWGSWLLPAAAVALAAVAGAGSPWSAADGPAVLPAVRGAGFWVALVILGGSVLVAVGAGPGTGRPAQRAGAPGVLLLSSAVGALLGAGVAEQVARILGGSCGGEPCLVVGEHVDWVAAAFAADLAVVLVVVAVVAVLRIRARGRGAGAAAVASMTRRASWLVALVGVVGALTAVVGLALLAVQRRFPPLEASVPAPLQWAVVGVLGLAAVAATLVGLRRVRWPRPLRLAAGVVAVALVGAFTVPVLTGTGLPWSFHVLGVPVPPTTFAQFAQTVVIVVPTAILLRRIVAGLTDPAVRRGVGVLWDVGTFWPRWFHPLAPPTYSDRAVTGLARRIEDPDPADPPALLVAAHSQGSVIAGTAVLGTSRRADLGRVALLTFGSPWRRLYRQFFPAYFPDAATAALHHRLGGRWRNLFRTADPIGGPVRHAEVDAPALADPCRRVHSDYWLEEEYRDAAAELVRALSRADVVAYADLRVP